MLALERNWRGPLLTNSGVETTLAQFQEMERSATPSELKNWRFQQLLYRAYYDAFLRDRLVAETAQQHRAYEVLRQATRIGAVNSLDQAQAILAQGVLEASSEDRRARINELAEALFQSIHMQLDSPRYQGQRGRGTTQDTLDLPLNDRLWLQPQFELNSSLDGQARRHFPLGV